MDFRKLKDKLEQAETAIKYEEREILKLQYENSIQTTISQISNIQNSDNGLAEKITQI